MGAEAVLALMYSQADSPALIISLDGNQIVRKQLMQCVEKVTAKQRRLYNLRPYLKPMRN